MPLIFCDPMGKCEENPPSEMLRQLLLAPPAGYWDQGGGGATLELVMPNCKVSMMLCPSSQYGVSLRYYDNQGNPWLSVGDADKFGEVTELYDEWYVSVALFVSNEKAWSAVKEFCMSGKQSAELTWIPASEIPDGGNW